MNKKLGRLLYPQTWVYFLVMGLFALAAFLLKQYILGAVEAVVTVIAYVVFAIHRRSRQREVQNFLNKVNHNQNGVNNVENPFPQVVIRMGDETILLANELFSQATGYSNGISRRTIGEVVPGFSADWLASGKTEYA